ncbi:MAG: TolC family protein [Bacteroidales bacterium]|nr:TolC family protein [Bacteroidales bacterium]
MFHHVCFPGFAQNSVLEEYIAKGIEGNLALQQKYLSYDAAIEELNEARGKFFPSLALYGRLSVAEGGRTIDFPAGDLLNPVYSTLNTLTQSNQFPQLQNQEIAFIRPFEHETKLQLIQPLFNPQIYYNNKIKQDLAIAKKNDAEAYKRALVSEIKSAYYNFLKSLALKNLVENTRLLIHENIRVNEKLYANDLVTIDQVYRSKTELARLEQKYSEVMQMVNATSAYFNFLLNQPFSTEISIDNQVIDIQTNSINHQVSGNREEIQMVDNYVNATTHIVKLNRMLKAPGLFGAVDYGFQGTRYSFTADDDFIVASLVLKWDLLQVCKTRRKPKKRLLKEPRLRKNGLSLYP